MVTYDSSETWLVCLIVAPLVATKAIGYGVAMGEGLMGKISVESLLSIAWITIIELRIGNTGLLGETIWDSMSGMVSPLSSTLVNL